MNNLPKLRYWIQHVIPLVYDDSLSIYELMGKVIEYLNNTIASQNEVIEDTEQLKSELAIVQKWIAEFDYAEVENLLHQYLFKGIMFGLTQGGYFCAWMPQSWKGVQFGTTGYDTFLPGVPQYGHLVVSYY